MMDEVTGVAGLSSVVCDWCRETVLLVRVEEDHDTPDEFGPSPSRAAVEPLCECCFEEISTTLKRCINGTAGPGGRCRPVASLQTQGSSQRDVRRETNEKSRQLQTMNELLSVEAKYWQAYSSLHLYLLNVADTRDSLQCKMERIEQHLSTINSGNGLHRFNYFKICLSSSGVSPIGTINGFRLGTLPTEPVEWWEVNTAWGVAVLLLEQLRIEVLNPISLKHRKSFWIENVGPVSWLARGSYPRVRGPSATYELVGPVSKILCPGYDKALVLFVKCLDVVIKVLEASASGGRPPFEISSSGDRIGGISVKYGLSRDVTWTSAVQRVLENLEWCLTKCQLNL